MQRIIDILKSISILGMLIFFLLGVVRILEGFCCFLGVLFLIGVFISMMLIEGLEFIFTASTADGIIIDIKEKVTDVTYLYPVVQFQTKDGKTKSFTHEEHSSLKIGNSVKVFYDPENPQKARLRKSHLEYIICGIYGFIAAMIFLVAGSLLIERLQFIFTASTADGTIIDIKKEKVEEDNFKYYPVIQFKTKYGKIQTLNHGDKEPSLKIGSSVKVLYDPEDPQNAELKKYQLYKACGFIVTMIFLVVTSVRLCKPPKSVKMGRAISSQV